MKKRLRIISVVLSIIMLVLALPISVFAEGTDTNPNTYKDGDLLLKMDTIFDAGTVTENPYGITVTDLSRQNFATKAELEAAEGEFDPYSAYVLANTTTWWASAGVSTDLPLSDSTKYTIEFDMKRYIYDDTEKEIFPGFGWSGTNTSNAHSIAFRREKASLSTVTLRAMKGTTKIVDLGKYSFTGNEDYIHYTIVVEGYSVTVYEGAEGANQLCEVQSLASKAYEGSTLSLLCVTNHTGRNTATITGADHPYVSIKDVTVTAGNVFDTEPEPEFEDGDILLTMPTLFDDEVTQKIENLTVSNVDRVGFYTNEELANAEVEGLQNDTGYVTKSKISSGWYAFAGVSTNLPLNRETAYTVDFYMKEHRTDAIHPGFAWSGTATSNVHGVQYRNGTTELKPYLVTTLKGTKGQNYAFGNFDNCETRLTSMVGSDGYVHYTVVINGYVIAVYVGGKQIGEAIDVSATTYMSQNLMLLTSTNYETRDFITDDETYVPIVSIKDITVTAGVQTPETEVEFVKNGVSLKTMKNAQTVAAADFPEVSAADGKVVKWFYKGTNAIVNDMVDFTSVAIDSDVTFEARELDLNATVVAGAQCTNADANNQQSVRFLATLHTLDASEAGFKIYAKYQDGDNVATMEWNDVKATVVYTSITATENGSVKSVTANELGGTYLIALAVNKVPTNIGRIDFYVSSYILVDGVQVVGETVVVSMNNGAPATGVQPL